MKDDIGQTEARRQYVAAYTVHYTKANLREALELYMDIIGSHPNTQEAEYSRSQIQNIVNNVVPKQELLDAQVELARAHLGRNGSTDVEPAPVTPVSSDEPRVIIDGVSG